MTKLHNYQNLSKNLSKVSRIICDWDDTITAKDTISLMFNLLDTKAPHNLDYFFKVYLDNYNNFITNDLPSKPYHERDTIEKEIAYQRDMKKIERSSLEEVVRLGTFKGFSRDAFQSQVANVRIRSGFEDFYRLISRTDTKFTVLSVNWTGLIIKQFFRNFEKPPAVVTNEFEFDDNGLCTGKPDSKHDIRTGYDKLIETKKIAKHDTGSLTIYVGDSATDVLSMIYCDRAVIIKGGSAGKTLRRLGFKVHDIDECITETDAKSLKYLEINDWHELLYVFNPSLYKL